MAQHTEPLNQGLVTARDASLLEAGELQRAADLMYRPASQSLHRVPGRIQFSQGEPPTGLRGVAYCGFDGAVDQVVTLADSALYAADAGENGTFAALSSTPGGDTLESVHYNNRHVLLTGGSANQVLLPAGTVRAHGMQPVTTTPLIELTTTTGSWPLVDDTLPGYYDYWTTEVYKTDTEEVEGTFTGTPALAFIQSSTYYVTIYQPAQVNPTATHWRIYRSIKRTSSGVSQFPVGFRIGEVELSGTANSFFDGKSTTTSSLFPSTTRVTSRPNEAYLTRADWASRDNMKADDGAIATATTQNNNVTIGGTIYTVRNDKESETYGFSMSGVGDPITDITVEVQGLHSHSAGRIQIALSWDGGINWTPYQYVFLTVGVTTIGTRSGLWGRTWNTSELQSGVFIVAVNATSGASLASVDHQVDYVAVRITHGGTTGDQSHLFAGFPVTVQGETVLVGSHGPPSVADTGDIFQESLVVNDIAHPTRVVYSLPGEIDYFPSPYILNLETKDKDRLTCIRSMGSVCLFGLAGQLQRANYLPRADDAEFDRGRCVEVVDNDNGVPGPFAACKFVLMGRLMVFYASRSGPRMTDGYESTTANDDLAWDTTVDLDSLPNCVAINNARYQEILLFYDPDGAGLSRCLRFQYHPTHLKNGKLKATGPGVVNVVGAAIGVNDLGERLLYSANTNGHVYLENRGDSDAAGVGITPGLTTRDLYLGGLGGEWELHRVLVHSQGATATTVSLRYTSTRSNLPERTTAPRDFIAERRGFNLVSPGEAGEGISVLLDATDNEEPLTFDYLVVEGRVVSQTTPLTR